MFACRNEAGCRAHAIRFCPQVNIAGHRGLTPEAGNAA
jgi:hypothetical protein